MQPSFDLSLLLLPTLAIVVVTGAASWFATRSLLLTFLLPTAKAALYLLYFGVVFDGSFTFLDDWTYLERGSDLGAQGVTWLNFLDNLDVLVAIGQGEHFLYYLYNATAIQWFGNGYYAPVALNIMLTGGIALLGSRLAVAEGFVPPHIRPAFFAWLMLHPDILSWSTVCNGKDVLVLLMHVVLLSAVSDYFARRRWRAGVQAGLAVLTLFFLRHYVPLLFGAAFAATALWSGKGWSRIATAITALLLFAGVIAVIGPDTLLFALDLLRADLVNPVVGLPKFLLTPIPFGTDAAYAFLNPAATLHWIMLPVLFIGLAQVVARHTPFTRVFVAYLLVFAALYAIYGELQGPRHRVQLDFAIALLQFVGVRYLAALQRSAPVLAPPPSPAMR